MSYSDIIIGFMISDTEIATESFRLSKAGAFKAPEIIKAYNYLTSFMKHATVELREQLTVLHTAINQFNTCVESSNADSAALTKSISAIDRWKCPTIKTDKVGAKFFDIAISRDRWHPKSQSNAKLNETILTSEESMDQIYTTLTQLRSESTELYNQLNAYDNHDTVKYNQGLRKQLIDLKWAADRIVRSITLCFEDEASMRDLY